MLKPTVTVLALSLLIAAALAANPPAQRKRMLVLPGGAYKAIIAEEAKLNTALAACKKVGEPRVCRSNAINAYSHRIEAILDAWWGRDPWGGNSGWNATGMDCFGDTRHNVASTCGGDVEQVSVPCTHCDPAHVQKTGGKCFIWACIEW
jgi:hypothetical protein